MSLLLSDRTGLGRGFVHSISLISSRGEAAVINLIFFYSGLLSVISELRLHSHTHNLRFLQGHKIIQFFTFAIKEEPQICIKI